MKTLSFEVTIMEILKEFLNQFKELARQYRIYFWMRKFPVVESKKYWETE